MGNFKVMRKRLEQRHRYFRTAKRLENLGQALRMFIKRGKRNVTVAGFQGISISKERKTI
jgi:hypothetical protein